MRLASALLLGTSLFLTGACADAVEPAREAEAGTPITLGVSYTIDSSVYGTERTINVYAPERPSWIEEPLPVVYVIDGGLDQDFIHIAGLSQLTLVNGERVPTIVVGVETVNRRQEITPAAQNQRYIDAFEGYGGASQFHLFLTDEVRPLIDANYEHGRTALMGESLAGLFVVDTYLRHPDSFDDYIAVSPSLWWDDQRLARDAGALLAEHEPAARRLYLTMANEGGTMQQGLDRVMDALTDGAPAGLEWHYVDRSTDDSHATIYHHSARDALGWLYGLPPYPEGELPWYLDPAESGAE